MFYTLISFLPFRVLYFFAWLAYGLIYYVVGYRRKVVRLNLSRAFPEKSPEQIIAMEKAFYRRFTQVALEIVKAKRMTKDDFLQRARIVNPELVAKHTKQFTESVILVTIHQGNWEWMLHGSSIGLGFPMDGVYKPLHNPRADKLIHDIRSQFGSRPLLMSNSARDILRRRREFRLFVMVADQSPIRSERGYWTQFMHQEANFYLGAETIAKATKFPVLFAQCRRVKTGYYEIEFKELAAPPYVKDSHAITDRYVELAERAIRDEPESWLWTNRRWKRDRTAEDAAQQTAELEATSAE